MNAFLEEIFTALDSFCLLIQVPNFQRIQQSQVRHGIALKVIDSECFKYLKTFSLHRATTVEQITSIFQQRFNEIAIALIRMVSP